MESEDDTFLFSTIIDGLASAASMESKLESLLLLCCEEVAAINVERLLFEILPAGYPSMKRLCIHGLEQNVNHHIVERLKQQRLPDNFPPLEELILLPYVPSQHAPLNGKATLTFLKSFKSLWSLHPDFKKTSKTLWQAFLNKVNTNVNIKVEVNKAIKHIRFLEDDAGGRFGDFLPPGLWPKVFRKLHDLSQQFTIHGRFAEYYKSSQFSEMRYLESNSLELSLTDDERTALEASAVYHLLHKNPTFFDQQHHLQQPSDGGSNGRKRPHNFISKTCLIQ